MIALYAGLAVLFIALPWVWWNDYGRDWRRRRRAELAGYEPDHPAVMWQVPDHFPYDWRLDDETEAAAHQAEIDELDRLRRLESRENAAERDRLDERVQRARAFTPQPISDDERRRRHP